MFVAACVIAKSSGGHSVRPHYDTAPSFAMGYNPTLSADYGVARFPPSDCQRAQESFHPEPR
jgi:hypothetical protein